MPLDAKEAVAVVVATDLVTPLGMEVLQTSQTDLVELELFGLNLVVIDQVLTLVMVGVVEPVVLVLIEQLVLSLLSMITLEQVVQTEMTTAGM